MLEKSLFSFLNSDCIIQISWGYWLDTSIRVSLLIRVFIRFLIMSLFLCMFIYAIYSMCCQTGECVSQLAYVLFISSNLKKQCEVYAVKVMKMFFLICSPIVFLEL